MPCGGGGGTTDSEETPAETSEATSPSTETSATEVAYTLEDRETFLATAPSCEEFEGWYEQFPADTDQLTALRFIETCHEAPPPVLNRDIYPGSERMLEALFDPAVSGESRAQAHWAIAKGVCRMFTRGSKSLWLVASDVRDYGGTPADYQAVVDEAVAECPSNSDDLTLFQPKDLLKVTEDFAASLRSAGADLGTFGPDPGDDIAALAAVVCVSERDATGDDNGFFFATLLDVDEGTGASLAADAVAKFCPQYG